MFYVTFISIRLSTIFGTSYIAAYNWSTLPPIVTFASRLHWPSAFTGIRTVWSSRRWREACMPREQPLFILSWKCYSEKTFAFLSTVYNKVDETLARKNTNKESRWVSTSTVCSACVLTDCPYLPLQYSRTQWTRTTRPRPCFSIFNTGSCQGNSLPHIILFCWSACMG